MERQLLQVNILVQHLPYHLSDLFSYMIVHTYCQVVSQWVRHLFIARLTRDHTSTLSSFNFRSDQILNVKASVIHYNTVMFADSTDHTVFRAVGNVIPGNKETYIKDLSEMWIRDALMGRLDQTYIFGVLLE